MPQITKAGTVTFYDGVTIEVCLTVETKKTGAILGKIVEAQSSNPRSGELIDKNIFLSHGDIHMLPINATFVADQSP
jgi:hypothetical protein